MTPARNTADTPARRLLRMLLLAAGTLAVLFFAIEGGEYGTRDVYTQRQRRDALKAELVSMHAEVDSLNAELRSVKSDDARLERIAREEFGMVKGDKEVVYWTTKRKPDAVADTGASRTARGGAADSLGH